MQFFLNKKVNVNARCDCNESHYTDAAFSAVICNPYKQSEERQLEVFELLADHGLAIPSLSYDLCAAIRRDVQSEEREDRKNRLFCKFIELRYGAASAVVSDEDKIDDFDALLKMTDKNHYKEIEPALIILLKNGIDPRKIDYGQSTYRYAYSLGIGEQLVETVRKHAPQYIDEDAIERISQQYRKIR
jgi:hypothetical protein